MLCTLCESFALTVKDGGEEAIKQCFFFLFVIFEPAVSFIDEDCGQTWSRTPAFTVVVAIICKGLLYIRSVCCCEA